MIVKSIEHAFKYSVMNSRLKDVIVIFPKISSRRLSNGKCSSNSVYKIIREILFLFHLFLNVYDDDEIEEQLKSMTNETEENYGEQLDELRERLKNMEAMLTQIHAEFKAKE